MNNRNLAARALANPLFRPKRVKPKKGKGSYNRKGANPCL